MEVVRMKIVLLPGILDPDFFFFPLPLGILRALYLKSFKVWMTIQITEEIGYRELGLVQDCF